MGADGHVWELRRSVVGPITLEHWLCIKCSRREWTTGGNHKTPFEWSVVVGNRSCEQGQPGIPGVDPFGLAQSA